MGAIYTWQKNKSSKYSKGTCPVLSICNGGEGFFPSTSRCS